MGVITLEDIDKLLKDIENESERYIPAGVDEKAYRKLKLKRAKLLKKVAEVEAEMNEMEQIGFKNSELGKAYLEARDSINKSYEKFDMDKYFKSLEE